VAKGARPEAELEHLPASDDAMLSSSDDGRPLLTPSGFLTICSAIPDVVGHAPDATPRLRTGG
jgi:hypothetical protein